MITEMRGAEFFELIQICNDCNLMRFYFFELIITVMEINSLAIYFLKLQMPFLSLGVGGRVEEGEKRRGGGEVTTFRAIRCPQSWTPCLLISASNSVCWREGREEKREEKGR